MIYTRTCMEALVSMSMYNNAEYLACHELSSAGPTAPTEHTFTHTHSLKQAILGRYVLALRGSFVCLRRLVRR